MQIESDSLPEMLLRAGSGRPSAFAVQDTTEGIVCFDIEALMHRFFEPDIAVMNRLFPASYSDGRDS
jgi:hypothetical protein